MVKKVFNYIKQNKDLNIIFFIDYALICYLIFLVFYIILLFVNMSNAANILVGFILGLVIVGIILFLILKIKLFIKIIRAIIKNKLLKKNKKKLILLYLIILFLNYSCTFLLISLMGKILENLIPKF